VIFPALSGYWPTIPKVRVKDRVRVSRAVVSRVRFMISRVRVSGRSE